MDITFLCVVCETRLVVDARMEGRDLPCPRCRAHVRVPNWSAPTESEAEAEGASAAPRLTPEEVQFLSNDPAS